MAFNLFEFLKWRFGQQFGDLFPKLFPGKAPDWNKPPETKQLADLHILADSEIAPDIPKGMFQDGELVKVTVQPDPSNPGSNFDSAHTQWFTWDALYPAKNIISPFKPEPGEYTVSLSDADTMFAVPKAKFDVTIHERNAISAGSGPDDLRGGDGNERLNGGSGNDRLYGGKGHDVLTGGTGKDFFAFSSISDSTVAARGRDTILDFSSREKDKIDLSAIDANQIRDGNQKFVFIGEKDFSGRPGELRSFFAFDPSFRGGVTVAEADVNGDKVADFAIELRGVSSVTKSDFYL